LDRQYLAKESDVSAGENRRPDDRSFFNINRPDELAAAEAFLQTSAV
jgi:molybdopterin-guanine dinucleotide biosynthesis protein A